jgi:AraC family transcriptional regulator of adaptative response/methylated-DNA-[protein]-cysteine methyltransferase
MSTSTLVDYRQSSADYRTIEEAIHYLERNAQRQPDLKEVAAAVGLSEFHFQRLFTRWAGISPKRFLQFITKEHAKELLDRSSNLLDTTVQVGLSSLGRLHDLFVTTEAVTPGEYKSRGAGLTVRYGLHPTPFGKCLLAVTDRGICHLGFVQTTEGAAVDELVSRWQQAEMVEDSRATASLVEPIFDLGQRLDQPLRLHLRGTNFQLKVWEALLRVQAGAVTTYSQIAERIGEPRAARAVGSAVGANPVPVLIPCHRVIRAIGEFGNYRYGAARKLALLGWEFSQAEPVVALAASES